ncbi:MAG TPA: VWA domain-containing protein [Terracidiphilus sp.]|nr:VWA domain-containing protein [Terracidiphilus sp.]
MGAKIEGRGVSIVTITAKQVFIGIGLCSGLLFIPGVVPRPVAQESTTRLHLNVDLVQLNVAVTDKKGDYITGLRPGDFKIMEDRIPEKIATFEEGNQLVNEVGPGSDAVSAPQDRGKVKPTPAREVTAAPAASAVALANPAGASVFILFDTSNYMYHGFVYAQDAITDFIRSMATEDRIAFYSYSRDLSRASTLTTNRFDIVRGVRSTVAGDDAALYNCLLLTVEDAAPLRGRKAIVVFSNGPDNASSVPPEDVAELAQSTGTIIYIISTEAAQREPVSTAAFERVSRATGGKAYFANNWRDEQKAFASIKDDLAHLYTLSYYPKPNPNRGFRTIAVKLVGQDLQKYRIRTRDGYSLQTAAVNQADYAAATDSDPNATDPKPETTDPQ